MPNISGFGSRAILAASATFPIGFEVKALADDGDPFDAENINIGDAAKGVNGDMIFWALAEPLSLTIRPIPTSSDDNNLKRVLDANMPSTGRFNAQDEITLTWIYPNGQFVKLSKGYMISGSAVNSVTSSGRQRTPEFAFKFGEVSRNF